MRDKLAWIGVVVVAVGIVLPWASYSASLGGTSVGHGTIPGHEYLQSFLALAISAVGALLSIKLSAQARRLTLVAAGVIVMVGPDLRWPI